MKIQLKGGTVMDNVEIKVES